MKKWFGLFALFMLFPVVVMAEIDISELTYEELIELKNQIEEKTTNYEHKTETETAIVETKGFQKMKVKIEIDNKGNISDVEVIEHSETPGIGGDVIDKDLGTLIGKNIVDAQIDIKSGVTHTCQGINDAIKQAALELGYPDVEAITLEEAETIISQSYQDVLDLLDGINEALDYWKQENLTTLSQIIDYELMWKKLEEKAAEMALCFECMPPAKYSEIWYGMKESLNGMAKWLGEMTNLNANGDERYTNEEMLELIINSTNEVLSDMQVYIGHYESYEKIEDSNDTQPTINKEKTNPSNSKNNQSSSEQNNSDSSKQNRKNIQACEVTECPKEGIKSFVGISGRVEYYCTQHYTELIEMTNSLKAASEKKGSSGSKTKKITEYSSNVTDDEKNMCWGLAKKWIKSRLKAPSSAKFPFSYASTDVTITKSGNSYVVVSWVEAPNSFNAVLRHDFIVMIEKDGSTYKVVDWYIDE